MRRTVRGFQNDERGAATVDWVVLTAACVGLALAAAYQVFLGSDGTTLQLTGALGSVEPVSFAGSDSPFAQYFYDIGIAAFPGDMDAAWRAAREAVHLAAPSGFEYDPGFTTTRFVDTVTGYPIYVSNDGLTYSIGGETIAVADYDTENRVSFRNAFNSYFSQG